MAIGIVGGWRVREPDSGHHYTVLRLETRGGMMRGTVLTIEQRNAAASLSIRLKDEHDPIRVSLDLADCVSVLAPPG